MSKELIERLKWRIQIRNAMNADRTDPITKDMQESVTAIEALLAERDALAAKLKALGDYANQCLREFLAIGEVVTDYMPVPRGIQLIDGIRTMELLIDAQHAQLVEQSRQITSLTTGLKALREQEPETIDWPNYHHDGMGCGLEDRGITDRYEAMRHGWDCAIERMAELLPEELYARPVPARELTDAVDYLAQHIRQIDGNHSMGAGELAESIAEWADRYLKGERE